MSDTEILPPRGLPAPLPEGETMLWQGAPGTAAIARDALHHRAILVYFLVAAAFVAGIAWNGGRSPAQVAVALGLTAAACGAVLGIVWIYAALVSRTAVYTITTRRIVMRVGVAFPITINLPNAIIAGAGLRTNADGSGDIPIALGGTGKLGYIHLWPHARPWRVARPEPMLRGVPEAGQVAAILARSLGAGALGKAAAARADGAVTDATALVADAAAA